MFSRCKYQSNLLKIAKDINATDVITKIIAFQPPKQPMYTIEPINANDCCVKTKQKHCCRYKKVKFLHEVYKIIPYTWIEQDCYTYKKTSKKPGKNDKNIVILHLKNKNKPKGGYTILFSHGNASSLGTMYTTYVDICTQLKCDLISYDYSGYGRSEGNASEKNLYTDIEEVGFFTNSILGISPSEIILLGQSLGSAASIHLAITHRFRDVRAIILLSPIASGVRLVSPDIQIQDLEKIDVFCNIKKIIDILCPIFLIHGQKDDEIPFQQSVEMSKFIKNLYDWHPRNGNHHNILTKYRTKFYQKCKFFFELLNYYTKKFHNNNNSITSHICEVNEKFYANFIKAKDDQPFFINLQDSYMDNKQNDEQEINGHAFSSKEIFTRDESFNSIPEDKKNNFNKHEKVFRLTNPHNSQLKDYPFDIVSDGPEESIITNQENELRRLSRESNMICFGDQKNLEDQYNMMLIKHNGI